MRHTATSSTILTFVLAAAATGSAQTRNAPAAPPDARAKPPSGQYEPAIDPQAIDALRRMTAFLGTQQSFAVETEAQKDYVLPSGEKVQQSSRGDLVVDNQSHRLRADLTSDRKERQFFFDGNTFTMYSPRPGYYTTVTVPAQFSNRQLADYLVANYGIELPLADVLRWSTGETDTEDLTRATYIGTEVLGDIETDHYAFRQRGLDWQVWIERGKQPVPRRIVMTTTDDPARPEYSVDLRWQLGARPDARSFAFSPPKGATKIPIEPAPRASSQASRSRRTQPTTED